MPNGADDRAGGSLLRLRTGAVAVSTTKYRQAVSDRAISAEASFRNQANRSYSE